MRTLIVITVFLTILSWLTDGSEGISSSKMLKLRRAFFTKRSFPPDYEEDTKYNCVINLCLPGLDECTKNSFTGNVYQFIDEIKEIQEKLCVTCFTDCAAKCMNNWRTFLTEA